MFLPLFYFTFINSNLGATYGDVMQQALGDCYLLSSFCILSTVDRSIEQLFLFTDEESGVYLVRLWLNGEVI